MLIQVTDFHDRGVSGVESRQVFINPDYVVAMEPWGAKFKVYVGRSLEYVVSANDAALLRTSHAAALDESERAS